MPTKVKCTALVRIVDDQGRLLFVVAPSPRRTIMRPLGGFFQSRPAGRRYLTSRHEASSFEGEDLCFVVPDAQVPNVYNWFCSRQGREVGIRRILNTRLVDELRVLTPQEVRPFLTTPLYFNRYQSATQHVSAPSTVYMIDVFNVRVPEPTLKRLEAAAQQERPLIRFITPAEIRDHSGSGDYISPLAPYLLRAHEL